MTQIPTKTINDLIETLKDGEFGFKTAAEDATSPELKRVLAEYSAQRADFSRKLQALVVKTGEEPAHDGSIAGSIHRGWINTKVALTSRTDLSILEECERGEDSAVGTYRDVISEVDMGDARKAIEDQFAQIRMAHDHIRSLRDSLSQKA